MYTYEYSLDFCFFPIYYRFYQDNTHTHTTMEDEGENLYIVQCWI